MMRFYDSLHNRLVYIENEATSNFWDEHWKKVDIARIYKRKVSPFNFVVSVTKKYLPVGSLVLEGGAGLAQNSWSLYLTGYKTIALDFARKTVSFLGNYRPEVTPILGDVRELPFKDESIEGYWSLGVIEHFYDGYDEILREMYRVLKKDGFLFLTFPYLNWLRKKKVKKGLYELWINEDKKVIKNFYQFVYDDRPIVFDFEEIGFMFVEKRKIEGLKGFKDEVNIGKKWLQAIYDGKTKKASFIRKLLNLLLSPFSSHMVLLVFRKK